MDKDYGRDMEEAGRGEEVFRPHVQRSWICSGKLTECYITVYCIMLICKRYINVTSMSKITLM